MNQPTKVRVPSGTVTILASVAVWAAVGCTSYPKYPATMWACDNSQMPDREPWCPKEERGENFMTIGFYESINGPLIFRIND